MSLYLQQNMVIVHVWVHQFHYFIIKQALRNASLHSRREDANKRFLGQSLTLPLAFFPSYLHREIALLLLDYDLQLSSASYQNKTF